MALSLRSLPTPLQEWGVRGQRAFGRRQAAIICYFSNLNLKTSTSGSRDVHVYVACTYIRIYVVGIKKSLVLQVSVMRRVHLKRINIAGTARAGRLSRSLITRWSLLERFSGSFAAFRTENIFNKISHESSKPTWRSPRKNVNYALLTVL